MPFIPPCCFLAHHSSLQREETDVLPGRGWPVRLAPGLYCSLMAKGKSQQPIASPRVYTFVQNTFMFRRALTQMSTNSKPPALSLQRCPRIPDRVYLIAGKICGGKTKAVTLLNYRVEADAAYTAPVSGPDRCRPFFKLRCSKHAVAFQLRPFSSPSPSDCCGEVFFRGYHPPSL